MTVVVEELGLVDSNDRNLQKIFLTCCTVCNRKDFIL